MTTAEVMAVAVLQGDLAAARALADVLFEAVDGVRLPPVDRVTCDVGKLRVVVFVDPELGSDVNVDRASLEQNVVAWLRGDIRVLGLVGVSRVELYEVP